ncbi:hypothetical protein SAMN05444166_3171 [Singulisphaera sp. GP187]|uniref:tetratricopeptide repeat protein n=1 Tax=Singulisphaera sp. GP187 TaxID=1882752 RepID=UPI00092A4CD4|nr:tetratricopeptide repeat protein [Singulisphaera sp. GP187]SIO23792.1 hypothetical protein SAMN05444166_3171 [Singulisphaera sp. GP187]
MNADEPIHDDPADTLAALERAKHEAIARCHDRTATRLAAELKRAAKAARRLDPYVWALHTLMNHAKDLLDPEPGREAAIELIAILESEELARQIQPDIDSAEYESLVSQVSSCAYDGLGHATASARGYNSEGVHDTIAEGIQVCRRTGKLECIHCFREYASDVFRASDDLEMALHHARHVAVNGNQREGFDRRWAGASEEAGILIIAGRIDAAEAAALRSLDLAESYHNPISARLLTHQLLETIRLLNGRDEPSPSGQVAGDETTTDFPPADEWPKLHLRQTMISALRSCLVGEPAAAISLLTTWDRRLTDRQCRVEWFEVRLRLIAAYLLAGDQERVAGLARQLESKARESRDWLTLRRLSRLLDPKIPVSPIAPAGPLTIGSATDLAPAVIATDEPAATAAPESPTPTPTPLGEALDALTAALEQEQDDPDVRSRSLNALLGFGPDVATHPEDVARMLHFARFICDDPAVASRVWDWAEAIASPFPREAVVLNLLAALGHSLRIDDDSSVADRIDAERIEQLFRHSLDLDPNHTRNYGRAAIYYRQAGQLSEAERCLARWLRLDRSNPHASLWLAEIYERSDRSRDALAVLDMALRAGTDAPEVAWQAALLAHSLEQNEVLLTYLDQFEKVAPGGTWSHYYRASGLLRLGRAVDAIAALVEEERRIEGGVLHVLILRACALSLLGRLEDFRNQLTEVMAVRLAGVDYLTHSGLVNLFSRLWDAAKVLPEEDSLRGVLVNRLLATGLAPNELFDGPRRANPTAEGLNFYGVVVVQPLDERWRDFDGCLAGEEEWTGYRIPWGVLASDEAEASRIALHWQAPCYPLEASLESVELRDEGYTDHPGMVWQGMRSSLPASE